MTISLLEKPTDLGDFFQLDHPWENSKKKENVLMFFMAVCLHYKLRSVVTDRIENFTQVIDTNKSELEEKILSNQECDNRILV